MLLLKSLLSPKRMQANKHVALQICCNDFKKKYNFFYLFDRNKWIYEQEQEKFFLFLTSKCTRLNLQSVLIFEGIREVSICNDYVSMELTMTVYRNIGEFGAWNLLFRVLCLVLGGWLVLGIVFGLRGTGRPPHHNLYSSLTAFPWYRHEMAYLPSLHTIHLWRSTPVLTVHKPVNNLKY